MTGRVGTVIFDLDGTLVDSAPDLADALDALLQDLDLEPLGPDVTRQLIGHGVPALVKAGLAKQNLQVGEQELAEHTTKFLQIYNTHISRKSRPYEGVRKVLDILRDEGWKLIVCTNKQEVSARKLLENLELIDQFSLVAGPDTFGVAKPNPDHLLNCLNEADKSQPVIVVGDSKVDCGAARAAGLPIALVRWGYCNEDVDLLGADAVVAKAEDIPTVVRNLAEGSVSYR